MTIATKIIVASSPSTTRVGFTLVELLVLMVILGILSGLLLPAVQTAREASRRAACQSNLRNHALAIQQFETSFGYLPAGRDRRLELDWSWNTRLLPMLEQGELYLRLDRARAWDDARNSPFTSAVLPIFRCPSSAKNFAGDCDYAGLTGTIRGALEGHSPFNRGALIYVDGRDLREITMASILDGVSQTLCVSENHDLVSPSGRWASGLNCLSHDRGRINSSLEGIRSQHPSGANAAFLDGSVIFLSDSLEEEVLTAWLTRSGEEVVSMIH
jgi:prepilin-type processing-associated H-X9-DG protein